MSKEIKLKIKGMHCKSCKILIEEEVGSINGVLKISVNHQKDEGIILVENESILDEVFTTVKKLGYSAEIFSEKDTSFSSQAQKLSDNTSLIWGLILISLFILGFFLIQFFGGFEILSNLNEKNVSFSLIFLIGLLASFHCVGMCGGLVVSYTINEDKEKKEAKSYKKHVNYNLGRLISYTIIGAILGGFGSFFGINPSFSGTILFIAGTMMILMGLSILTNFKWIKILKSNIPFLKSISSAWGLYDKIAKYLYKNNKSEKPKGPLFIGLLTGFMPCGPLQAMQLYALTTGSMTQGAISMFLYALGTIPLMFGFGNVISMLNGTRIKQIIKISGSIVIILGLVMLNRGLTNFGLGFGSTQENKNTGNITEENKNNSDNFQIITMDVTYSGYKPNIIYIKKDLPVRWVIKDKGITGCTNEIILYHENGIIKKKLNQKENIIEFTPTKLGELKFSCWMNMVWGKFIVI